MCITVKSAWSPVRIYYVLSFGVPGYGTVPMLKMYRTWELGVPTVPTYRYHIPQHTPMASTTDDQRAAPLGREREKREDSSIHFF